MRLSWSKGPQGVSGAWGLTRKAMRGSPKAWVLSNVAIYRDYAGSFGAAWHEAFAA